MLDHSRSTYFYEKKGSKNELYLKTLEEYNDRNCFFARGVYSSMDADPHSMSDFYMNHVFECDTCRKIYHDRSKEDQIIRSLIPIVELPKEFEHKIERGLKGSFELYRNMKNSNSTSMFRSFNASSSPILLINVPTTPPFNSARSCAFLAMINIISSPSITSPF